MRLAAVPIPGTRPEGPLFGPDQLRQLFDVARMIEAAGIDDLGMSEHVVMSDHPATYPWGPYPHTFGEPYPEPVTTLTALAAVTQRIRLISTVVIAPLRPAVFLAKQVATAHALSGGRFVLGVSTSWQREEYEAMGMSFDDRGQRLNDIVGACRALWSSAPASFSSPSVSFEDMICIPRPDHPDDIPIWFGSGFSQRLVKRVAQHGAGWMPFIGTTPNPMEMIANGSATLRKAMQDNGRDPNMLEVSALLLPKGRSYEAAIAEDIPAFKAAGVTHLRVQISMFVASFDEIEPFLIDLKRRVDAASS